MSYMVVKTSTKGATCRINSCGYGYKADYVHVSKWRYKFIAVIVCKTDRPNIEQENVLM